MEIVDALKELRDVAIEHPMFKEADKIGYKIALGKGQQKEPDYLFLGEALGHNEAIQGKPFVGKSGKILDGWIQKNYITSYCVINSVPLIPLKEDGGIRTPTKEEVEYFRSYTINLIGAINPKNIICLGKTAGSCLQVDFKNTQWTKFNNINCGTIYHPSYFLRKGQNGDNDFMKLLDSHPSQTEKLLNNNTIILNVATITALKEDVSKTGRPYYRVTLDNGVKGMCMFFSKKLQVGQKVKFKMEKDPFINLVVLDE